MNFASYSQQQFVGRGLDTPEARQLADELEQDVLKEIHQAVGAAFLQIIAELNKRGHNLTPYGEIQAGDISFRDKPTTEQCFLRLGCDVVISAGYSHTFADETPNYLQD